MRKIMICVIGKYDEKGEHQLAMCQALGRLIAQSGAILIVGGGGGIMGAVAKGAREAGGITLGFLAETNPDAESEYLDIAIPTGVGYEIRSALAIRASDIIIMVGGCNGTLGELSMAYLHHKSIIVLSGSLGWADRIASVLIDGKYLDERKNTPIQFVDTPEECMQRIVLQANNADLKKAKLV